MDMNMGMSMGVHDAKSSDMQKAYWIVIGVVVAFAALGNLHSYSPSRRTYKKYRISASRNGQDTPAKPKALFWRLNATLTALYREASSASFSFPLGKNVLLHTPTIDRTFIIGLNVIILLVLCFYRLDVNNRLQFESIGYRTGYLSCAQLPLIFLLSGKNNIIGWLSGSSYERLNWLHRWTARCLLLTVTIHMGYWFADWAPYDYIGTKIRTDPITQKGIAAWAILVWIVFSSMTPIRGWSYEFFVLQHLVSFAAFIGVAYIHTPPEFHVWFWISIGLFFFDRVLRMAFVVYTNLSIFHPKQRREGQMSGLWACKAEFKPASHNTTRITIKDPPIRWKPGQHVFLSCHSIVPLQSHPFTIASIPEDGKMEFFVKAEKGGTKRLFRFAEKHNGLPTAAPPLAGSVETKAVAIQGPFGQIRPLRQFDSVVLLAGSTGATFTVPLLRDLLSSCQSWAITEANRKTLLSAGPGVVTRHVRFVWVVKSTNQLNWFSDQLSTAIEDIKDLRKQGCSVEMEMSIYITCDDTFTNGTLMTDHQNLPSLIQKLPPSQPSPSRTVAEPPSVPAASISEKNTLEKGLAEKSVVPKSLSSSSLSSETDKNGTLVTAANACRPDGTCCCQSTIEDEDAISSASANAGCACNCAPSPNLPSQPTESASSSQSSTLVSNKRTGPLLHPSISVFSGRPQPRNIIRKTLEQALGETAVVVCGPKALVRDVRSSMVGLSDERAVHKGTGAQGIYLHTESFGY